MLEGDDGGTDAVQTKRSTIAGTPPLKSPSPKTQEELHDDVFGKGPETKAEMILKKWLGVPTKAAESSGKVNGDDAIDSMNHSIGKPSRVNKTIRKWQKRAMYGKVERATGLQIDEDYKTWYIDQRDRFRVQLPEALRSAVAEEALAILKPMCARYEKLLGPDDELVQQANLRRTKIEQELSGMGQDVRKILRSQSRGVSLRTLGFANNNQQNKENYK
ncbi:Hypothetical Protein FCC1311_084042 [Hondaea fermentalgiana]|uniref:Uncharacterized protein n=1 Tax=Hondaea fermentalgiana TaxID=2315210 RepID=A0A2R5GPE7_9STRA|nr:Hypothetical Protein FCC1311_084042 [Hondaea fermentalgiana]|eukprot:GBG32179.1 Hypothetical Protein FCC1311_084042 [Hondaea fermentalgiana]